MDTCKSLITLFPAIWLTPSVDSPAYGQKRIFHRKIRASAIASLLLACSSAVLLSAAPVAADLRVNDLREPLVFDHFPLRFSWKVSGDPKASQSAYQIELRRRDVAAQESGRLWDSGRVESAINRRIGYTGPALKSRELLAWRVRLWDQNSAEGPWSPWMDFETGLLDSTDWAAAKWIGCDRDMAAGETAPADVMGPWISGPKGEKSSRFVLDFDLPDKPVVWALGWWGVNRPAGHVGLMANLRTMQGELRRNASQMARGGTGGFHELSFVLAPGKSNRLELIFKNPPPNVSASVGMHIVFADGSEQIIRSGENWQAVVGGAKSVPARVVAAYGKEAGGLATILATPRLPPIRIGTDFEVKPGLKRARLYLCGLGWNHPLINGQRTDDHVWSPAQTDYEEFAFYETRDATSLLREGQNRLDVLLDAGCFHDSGGFGAVRSYGRPGLIARLALDYADGTTRWVDSGPNWKWASSEITQSNLYQGEWVDFRKIETEEWRPVQMLEPLSPRLIASDIPPVRVMQTIAPKKVQSIGPKSWLVDFGEMMNGCRTCPRAGGKNPRDDPFIS